VTVFWEFSTPKIGVENAHDNLAVASVELLVKMLAVRCKLEQF
jgi:hypothetical protein